MIIQYVNIAHFHTKNNVIRQKTKVKGGKSAFDFCPPRHITTKAKGRLDPFCSGIFAAEREGREVDPEIILSRYHEMQAAHDLLIVEGVGGLLVPLRRDVLLVDLMAKITLPTLLVAKSGLGTINHTLLSLEALRSRKIPVLGVVFSDGEDDLIDEDIVADNMRVIAETGQCQVFGRMCQQNTAQDAVSEFNPIGTAILDAYADDVKKQI